MQPDQVPSNAPNVPQHPQPQTLPTGTLPTPTEAEARQAAERQASQASQRPQSYHEQRAAEARREYEQRGPQPGGTESEQQRKDREELGRLQSLGRPLTGEESTRVRELQEQMRPYFESRQLNEREMQRLEEVLGRPLTDAERERVQRLARPMGPPLDDRNLQPLRPQSWLPNLTPGQFFRWGLNHIEVVEMIGDAAARWPMAQSANDRWLLIRPVGDVIAPAIDDLYAPTVLSDADVSSLEAQLVMRVSQRPHTAAIPRDGTWLRAALQLLQMLLTIVTTH